MLKAHWKTLLIFFAIIIAGQLVGASISSPGSPWFQNLVKPSWQPPNWVFGPVWTSLYILIAISGWRVWTKLSLSTTAKLKHRAIRCYGLMLAYNFIWTPIFFGMHLLGLSVAVILLLAVAIALTLYHFSHVDKPAMWMQLPHLLWVLYASTVNIGVYALNV